MKASDLKVVAIILAIALFFTIVTSNAVSIASVVMLAKGGVGGGSTVAQGDAAGDQQGTTPSGSTSTTPSGSTSTTPSGSTSTTPSGSTSTTPSGSTSTTPSDSGTSSTPTGGNDTPADKPADKPADSGNTDKPADQPADKPADQPAAADGWDTAKVFNFYKDGCDKILSNGIAGHTRKEWQEITSLQLGSGSSGDALLGIIKGFVTSEADAGESVSDKGSDDAKRRMAPCGSSVDYVQSATKEDLPNGNYKITIVMKDENTPVKGSAGIAAMSTGILYMEDVQDTIQNDKTVSVLVKGLGDGSGIMYRAYTITAEMTKDGKFVDINHVTTGEITANAKLLIGSISGNGTLVFHSHWYNFNY